MTMSRWTSSTPLGDPLAVEVLHAAAAAPQFSWARDWHILWRDDAWWLRAAGRPADLPQGQVLTIGGAAQSMAIRLQAEDHRVQVDLLPNGDSHALVRVRSLGPASGARARSLVLAASLPEQAFQPRALLASDLRHLMLSAESLECELMWQRDAASAPALDHADRLHAAGGPRSLTTVVTRSDSAHDWLRAGQALVQCRSVAQDLGFAVHLGPHALGRRATRESTRSLWQLSGWPQVQLSLVTQQDPDV